MNLAIVLAIILVLIGCAFLFYRKIIGFNVLLLNLLFPLLFVVGMISLFWSAPFDAIADTVVSNSALASQLKGIDQGFSSMNDFSKSVTDSARFLLPNIQPLNLQTNLYQQYTTFVSELLRVITIIICFAGVILITYLRYVFASTFEVVELRKRVSALEAKLNSTHPSP